MIMPRKFDLLVNNPYQNIMSRLSRKIIFLTHFQGSEFNSTTGFDRITQKTKQGRQSVTDYIEFVKKRYCLQLHYLNIFC